MSTLRKQSSGRLWIISYVISFFAIILSSCPSPIDVAILNRIKDNTGPVIVITSPADGSNCANIVQVNGTVADSATATGDDGGVTSLSYEILGTTTAADLTLETDGSFSFQFTANSFGDTFTLAVTAMDWNGNSTTESIILHREAGSGLPSFTAVAGNKSVILEWNPVPNTASYTLRYTTNGALPSGTVGTEIPNVSSPVEILGLANGNLHVFQLFTVPVDIPDDPLPVSISDFIRAVPLSEQTLAPRASGEVGGIRVEWDSIPATDEYEVWRSTQTDGVYSNLSGPLTSTSYTDTETTDGTWYFYRVKPAYHDNGLSDAAGAQTDALNIHSPYVVGTTGFQNLGPDAARGYRIAVDGNYAYVADVEGGLQIVDITDPENAMAVGQCATADRPFDVSVSGDYAFVADGSVGMTVVDISDKSGPVVRTTVHETGYFALSIVISGHYAYVTDNDWDTSDGDNSTIQIYDISNPEVPVYSGAVAASATALDIEGDYLYAACPANDPDDFQIFTLTGSGSPTAPDRVNAPNVDALSDFTWDLKIQGDYAYIADRADGLRVVDVTNRGNPSYTGIACATPGDAYEVVLDGRYAFVAARTAGVQVIDVSNPASVSDNSIVGYCATPGNGLGIVRKGSYLYVADWQAGLTVVRATFPHSAPQTVGSVSSADQALSVAVQGPYAYVANQVAGLRVVDVLNPTSPSTVSTLSFGDYDTLGVEVRGNRAYLSTTKMRNTPPYGDGLQIVDISDPTAPVAAGFVTAGGGAHDLTTQGAYAFITNSDIGVHLIDISDPEAPEITALLNTNGIAMDVAVKDSYLYVADGPNGFTVADITHPTTPIRSDEETWPAEDPGGVSTAVSGNYAYVVHTNSGSSGDLQVVDVTNPYGIVVPPAATVALSDAAGDVTVQGSYVFVADGTDGLQIIDVWDPVNPVIVSTCPLPNATDVAVSGRYAYVTTSDGDLKIVDLLPDL